MTEHSMRAALHFLSCLPQFCYHRDEKVVLDMQHGIVVDCVAANEDDALTHLLLFWPGNDPKAGIRVGAEKYLQLQAREAIVLGEQPESIDLALAAVLMAIS